MINEAIIQNAPGISVFARNHREYLEAAVARNNVDPSTPTTFRARTVWKNAQLALHEYKTIKIYFAPVGGMGNIEFSATLHYIKLNPTRDDGETNKYLGFALSDNEVDGTSDEGLWEQYDKQAKTLYVITHCKRINPFSFTELIKLSDNKPISPDFGYSYSLVHEYTAAPGNDFMSGSDDVAQPNLYPEGATRSVFVNAYERSRSARKKCIDHYKPVCIICKFDFQKIYGEKGKGIIHVHHVKPLSEIDQAYKVDAIRDLRPVCPNCHAVIHSRSEPFTIDQVKEMILKSSVPSDKL